MSIVEKCPIILVLPLAAALSACAPRDMETTPIKVETSKGTVVCQLYTHDIVYWDRAIHIPTEMSADHADGICRAKGQELANSIKAVAG